MNIVTLTGRLGADVELRQTQQGVSVCTFALAVNRPRTKDTTDWINCVAWRQSAEFLNRFTKKGDLIAVAGILTSRKYEDMLMCSIGSSRRNTLTSMWLTVGLTATIWMQKALASALMCICATATPRKA